MSAARDTLYAERKALLATRAELDRTRVALALREVKVAVVPPRDADRAAHFRSAASMAVRILGPLAGAPRLGRWLRIASVALAVMRVVRGWR